MCCIAVKIFLFLRDCVTYALVSEYRGAVMLHYRIALAVPIKTPRKQRFTLIIVAGPEAKKNCGRRIRWRRADPSFGSASRPLLSEDVEVYAKLCPRSVWSLINLGRKELRLAFEEGANLARGAPLDDHKLDQFGMKEL